MSGRQEVIVITGAGGMGISCARRLGSGRQVLIGDVQESRLAEVAELLSDEGHAVVTRTLDVTEQESVEAFAEAADRLGRIRSIVHTAGISPSMATPGRVLEVDMIGTDRIMTAFLPLVTEGTVGVVIASMAGYLAGLSAEQERALATAARDALTDLVGPVADLAQGASYCIAKRVNHLRVEQSAAAWGRRGGRIVSVSPGIISTSMTRQELAGDSGAPMRAQLAISAVDRMGTADDIAAAVEFLCSAAASFITGCDLRVDGGVTAAIITTRQAAVPASESAVRIS